jgi:hypothetical protein
MLNNLSAHMLIWLTVLTQRHWNKREQTKHGQSRNPPSLAQVYSRIRSNFSPTVFF